MYYEIKSKHPDITPDIKDEMWIKINEVIAAYRSKPGAAIPVLRECQNIVGYLPVSLIDYISRGLNISASHVFGVASFYSLFSFKPKGRHTIRVCKGTACYVKGIKDVIERIKGTYGADEGETTNDRRFSLETVRCLGACGLAPVMVIDGEIYGDTSANRVVSILENYK